MKVKYKKGLSSFFDSEGVVATSIDLVLLYSVFGSLLNLMVELVFVDLSSVQDFKWSQAVKDTIRAVVVVLDS